MFQEMKDKLASLEETIETCETALEKNGRLTEEMDKIAKVQAAIQGKYAGKYGIVKKADDISTCSDEEIARIRAELADNRILTILKRLLGLGKKQEVLYREYMAKLNGLSVFLENEKHVCGQELQRGGQKIRALAGELEADYLKIRTDAGSAQDTDWQQYTAPSENGKLYFGDVDMLIEAEMEHCEGILQKNMTQSYQEGFVHIPYVREIETPFQVVIQTDGRSAEKKAADFMRSILYQLLRGSKAYALEMHLIDGEKTGGAFSELMQLKKVAETEVLQYNRKVTEEKYKLVQTYLSDQDIAQGMRELDDYIGRAAEELAGMENLQAYNRADAALEDSRGMIPQQMLVIQNFPAGFREEDAKILNKLIKNGKRLGLSFLIQYDQKNRERYTKYMDAETQKKLDILTIEDETVFLSAHDCSSAIRLEQMAEGKDAYVKDLIQKKTAEVERDNSFAAVIGMDVPFGTKDATNGIYIPFALDKRGNVVEYMLGEALNAHGLISGGTGSGKSTLLHMLISSLCMNYTPDDVELWLVDYKITEFNTYKTNTPPHIRFLGLSTTVDFTYAFLDKILAEMRRRQHLIEQADHKIKQEGRQTNITNIKDYRAEYGKAAMTRLLIIVDEFHVMAQQANLEPAYKQKLENILAEGRALGITMVLSDQAVVDGLNGLTEKGRKQIKARLALANEADELKAMLQGADMDMIRPLMTMKRGETAVIRAEERRTPDGDTEEVLRIERVKIIYINGEWRFKVCSKVRELYHAETYTPNYVNEQEIRSADWEAIGRWEKENLKVYRDGSRDLCVYIGSPLDLSACQCLPMLPRKTNNIMCVGGREDQRYRILKAVVESCACWQDCTIYVFADRYANLYREYEEQMIELHERGVLRLVTDKEEMCACIHACRQQIKDRKNTHRNLAVWIGLDDIVNEFQEYPEERPSCYQEAEAGKKKKKPAVSWEADALFAQFDAMFGEKTEPDTAEAAMEAGAETDETNLEAAEAEWEEEKIYNAYDDIVELIHDGPAKGVWNLVFYDTAATLRDLRKIKTDDFRHKIAFAMSRDDALDYLGRSNLMEDIKADKETAGYYDGQQMHKFIPYA